MATRLRTLGRQLLLQIDDWYGRCHGLRPCGPILLLGCKAYQGAPREFYDGTYLQAAQRIGILHFNNAQISALGQCAEQCTRQLAGVRFARLFRQSLRGLAQLIQSDPALLDINVYYGLTWFRMHGGKVGFVSEAMPASARLHWLTAYFRFLEWGFSPVASARRGRVEPRSFWITRNDLIKNFSADR